MGLSTEIMNHRPVFQGYQLVGQYFPWAKSTPNLTTSSLRVLYSPDVLVLDILGSTAETKQKHETEKEKKKVRKVFTKLRSQNRHQQPRSSPPPPWLHKETDMYETRRP